MIWAEATAMGDVLLRTAERLPSNEALVFGADRFSYAEVRERALAAARSLAGLGVRRGDRVGLLMPNCPDFVFAFFGIQLLGAVAVPINTRFRARELGYVIENAGLVALLTSDIVDEAVDFVQRLGEALPGLDGQSDPAALALPEAPRLRSLVLLGAREPDAFLSRARFDALGGAVSEQSVLDGRLRVRVRDIGLMLFTSGTTAAAEGLPAHARGGRAHLVRHRAAVPDRRGRPHLGRAADVPHVLPRTADLHVRARRDADLDDALRAGRGAPADRARARELAVHGVPTDRHGARQAPGVRGHGPLGVRGLMNVAPPDTLSLIQDAFAPARQMGGHFGMTECARRHHLQRVGRHPPPAGRHVRRARAGRGGARRRPRDGRGAGPGRARGAADPRHRPVRGLSRRPGGTAASITDDGWLRSGDAGQIDADGMVIYLGRIKEMMKVGGENVAPAEIESHLRRTPRSSSSRSWPCPTCGSTRCPPRSSSSPPAQS